MVVMMMVLLLMGGKALAADAAEKKIQKWDNRACYLTDALEDSVRAWDDESRRAHSSVENPFSLRGILQMCDQALAEMPAGAKNGDALRTLTKQAKDIVHADDLKHWDKLAELKVEALRALEHGWETGTAMARRPEDDPLGLRGTLKSAEEMLEDVPDGAENLEMLKTEIANARALVDSEDAAKKK